MSRGVIRSAYTGYKHVDVCVCVFQMLQMLGQQCPSGRGESESYFPAASLGLSQQNTEGGDLRSSYSTNTQTHTLLLFMGEFCKML